jgi:hypothetical protein
MTVQPRTEPVIFVTVVAEGSAGRRVDLSEKVLSLVYEDSEHKADKLVLSVDNWDLANFDDPVWKKGNFLEVSWGYPGDMAPTRRVVIQKVTGFQVLAIEGYATSVLMNKVTRSRTFEHQTRADSRSPWRTRRGGSPGDVTGISIKVGHPFNPTDARGRVEVDDLRIE